VFQGDMVIVLNVATKCYLGCTNSYVGYWLSQTYGQVICTNPISNHSTLLPGYFIHLFCMMDYIILICKLNFN